jgi:hypothetical protein
MEESSLLSLISTLIGSGGIVVLIATTLLSNLYQPNIDLNVIKRYDTTTKSWSPFEVFIKNVGGAEAKNVTFSMFFRPHILLFKPMLYDQNIKYLITNFSVDNNHFKGHISFINGTIQNLSSNGLIILYIWTDAKAQSSYYISVAFGKGTTRMWALNGDDNGRYLFADLKKADVGSPANSNILLISSLISFISFTVVFIQIWVRKLNVDARRKFIRKMFVILPVSIIVSAFIITFEHDMLTWYQANYTSPVDITQNTKNSGYIFSYQSTHSIFQYEAINQATVFVLGIFAIRGTIGYVISRLVIKLVYPKKPRLKPFQFNSDIFSNAIKTFNEDYQYDIEYFKSFKEFGKLKIFIYSFVILGLPFESVLNLFFIDSILSLVHTYINFYLILLLIDAIRMTFFLWYITRRNINTI